MKFGLLLLIINKGKAPDIGAYEYGGEPWIPGITWGEYQIRVDQNE